MFFRTSHTAPTSCAHGTLDPALANASCSPAPLSAAIYLPSDSCELKAGAQANLQEGLLLVTVPRSRKHWHGKTQDTGSRPVWKLTNTSQRSELCGGLVLGNLAILVSFCVSLWQDAHRPAAPSSPDDGPQVMCVLGGYAQRLLPYSAHPFRTSVRHLSTPREDLSLPSAEPRPQTGHTRHNGRGEFLPSSHLQLLECTAGRSHTLCARGLWPLGVLVFTDSVRGQWLQTWSALL